MCFIVPIVSIIPVNIAYELIPLLHKNTQMSALPVIAISIGDPNGVGLEVILKTFNHPSLFDCCIPVVYGDFEYVKQQQQHFGTAVPIAALEGAPSKGFLYVKSILDQVPDVVYGAQAPEAGRVAFLSLQAAALAVQDGEANALVTAPIHKASIKSDAFPFAGHTHYLANLWGNKALMVLVHDNLRVALVTDHIPLSEVTKKLSKSLLLEKARQLYKSLKSDFGCDAPKIALLGVNPHAGDQGVIGSEDDLLLKPIIEELNQEGIRIKGPFAADGFFGQKSYVDFDAVLSCYHDQGLVGFKTLAFGKGVNVTAGLPHVRTSPDHGTAFDIAGKGIANHASFAAAVKMACTIWNTRQKNL